MEEFYRHHPEVIDGDNPSGKEEETKFMMQRWKVGGRWPIPKTRIFVGSDAEERRGKGK